MNVVVVQESPVQTVVINKDPTTVVEINHLGLQGPRGAGPEFIHELRSLTLAEATNNKLILNRLADKDSLIIIHIEEAPSMLRDIDYEYLEGENAISWVGKSLENFLNEQENIEIIYLPKN
jgi:hypothetical protein